MMSRLWQHAVIICMFFLYLGASPALTDCPEPEYRANDGDATSSPEEAEKCDLGAALSSDYDLLIIIGGTDYDSYLEHIQPFIEWKEIKGIRTKVLTSAAEVASIQDKIVNELQYNIGYVLLVGNLASLNSYVKNDPYTPSITWISDFYYTLLEGDDWCPEIAIGRFPVDNTAELDYMVQKSINFERDYPPQNTLWNSKVLFIEDDDIQTNDTKQLIIDENIAADPCYFKPTFITAFGDEGATNQDIIATISTGVRVVNYLGHGEDLFWEEWNTLLENFGVTEVAAINNDTKTPVVFSMSCHTADLSNTEGCLAEHWLLQPEGAVAYYGASMASFTTTTNELDKAVFTKLFVDGVPFVGDAINNSIIDIINCTNPPINDRQILERYILLGDPTLEVVYVACDLRSPKMISPKDGEIFPPGTQIELDWAQVNEADYYCVQVSKDFGFDSVLHEALYLKTTGWTTPALEEGTHYWRVWAGDERGYGEIPYSSSYFNIEQMPDAPVLCAPEDGTEYYPGMGILFKYYKLPDIDSYILQIDDKPSFNSPIEEIVCSCTEGPLCSQAVNSLSSDVYYWRVRAESGTEWSDVWSFEVLAGLRTSNSIASHPNPFNPTTTIIYSIAKPSHVNLSIYNVSGQLVRRLVDEFKTADEHRVEWDGTDDRGLSVASGIYFYSIKADGFNSSKKLILLR